MPKITLPNGFEVDAYPLSAPQMFMYGMEQIYGGGGKLPINNIAFGYYRKRPFDETKIKEAIAEAVARCDTMRLRFIPVPESAGVMFNTMQFVVPNDTIEVESFDFSDISVAEAEDKLMKISREKVPFYNEKLHKIALVKFSDGTSGIYMKLQHLAMDAYSVKVFLRDIMEIYLHKTEGKPYPKPMRPYIPTLIRELQYLQSDKIKEDYKYWAMTLATTSEPIFTDYMLESRLKKEREKFPERRFANIHGASPEEGVIIKDMTGEETKSVMDMAEKKGLSVAAILLASFRTALSVFNDNEEDVSIKMIVNRRATIDEKKSGGLRINFFPMRSIVSPDKTFAEAVKIIEAVQADIYPHCGLPFTKMLEARHAYMPKDALEDSTYDSAGFSYQPLMNIPNEDEETRRSARSVWYNNGASMIPLYITVRHRAADDGFEFVMEHQLGYHAEYDIEVFYTKMYRTLKIAAENPDITVGEILEKIAVTQEERDGKNG